jgi:hypothetical protein
MSKHPQYDRARRALDDVFGDTTVSLETTREALVELASDIDGFLMNLDEDEDAPE